MEYVLLVLGTLIIGVSKAGFGGGAGMIVAPMIASVIPSKQAIAIMLPLLLTTDLMALVYYRGQWDRRCVVALIPASLAGIALGGVILRHLDAVALTRVIGAVALAFALLQLRGAGRKGPAEPPSAWLGASVGFGAGVVSTLAHIGGMLTSLYLVPRGLSPQGFVATASAVYCLMNAAKLAPYAWNGLLTPQVLRMDLLLLPVLVAGAGLGFYLNRRFDSRGFSRLVLWIVIATGAWLLVQPR